MRTTWNGAISFGLVTIPIGLAIATEPRAKASDVTFRTLHRECGTPIKQKRWCPVHDREVGPDELVKGWEVTKGQFVLIEDDELEAIEVDTSPSIDIERFVQLEEIDPIFFDRTYYLAPVGSGGSAAAVRAAARRDARDEHGRARTVRAARLGEDLPDPPLRERARARDAVPRRGHPLEGRDRGGRGRG